MKKLLTAVLALSAATTFAANENMVRFQNMYGDVETRSFDVSFDTTKEEGGTKDAESATSNVALNYARAFGQWQVGVTYKNYSTANGADTTMGLSGYYNLNADLANTGYVALHYMMSNDATSGQDDDVTTTIAVEYGQRWAIANAWGLNLAYSPSVTVAQATTAYDADGSEDQVYTSVSWAWVNFDVMF